MGALNNETRDFRPQLDNELEAKKRLLLEDEGLSAVASASAAVVKSCHSDPRMRRFQDEMTNL